MRNVPDNYDAWIAHETAQEKALLERCVCDYCEEPIQDNYHYEINGDCVCQTCLDYHFRKDD